jgi:WD40 repeat protein
MIASASADRDIRLWEADTGITRRILGGHERLIRSVAWSPDGRTIASGSDDETIRLWSAGTGENIVVLGDNHDRVTCVAWSPDGTRLACSYDDATIQFWEALAPWPPSPALKGHISYVMHVAWSPDGTMLASSSTDATIRLWDPSSGVQKRILTGHPGIVGGVSFSADGYLLASKGTDNKVILWRRDRWEIVAILDEPSYRRVRLWHNGLAFHPSTPVLATLGEEDTVVRIWDLDLDTLLYEPARVTVHYTNAKVVLVGDSGVGKSGLGLVLSGQSFVPTEPTHGRHVWTLGSQETKARSVPKSVPGVPPRGPSSRVPASPSWDDD